MVWVTVLWATKYTSVLLTTCLGRGPLHNRASVAYHFKFRAVASFIAWLIDIDKGLIFLQHGNYDFHHSIVQHELLFTFMNVISFL